MFVLEVSPNHRMFMLFNPLIEVTTRVANDNLYRTNGIEIRRLFSVG